jgi:hypothetical protein
MCADGGVVDELPSLSQLLPYPRDPAVVPVDIPRAANVSPHLIRGSNYKGKAVYFGKKYKRTALQVCIFHFGRHGYV